MDEKQRFIAHWEQRRGRGPVRFILRSGSIIVIILLVTRVLVDLFEVSLRESVLQNLSMRNLFPALVAGLAVGAIEWFVNEKHYRKIK